MWCCRVLSSISGYNQLSSLSHILPDVSLYLQELQFSKTDVATCSVEIMLISPLYILLINRESIQNMSLTLSFVSTRRFVDQGSKYNQNVQSVGSEQKPTDQRIF